MKRYAKRVINQPHNNENIDQSNMKVMHTRYFLDNFIIQV